METSVLNWFLAPIKNRVRLMVTRSILDLVDDSGGRQLISIHRHQKTDGDDNIERFQNYGFTSRAHTDGGAETVDVAVGGNGAHRVTICVDDRRYRFHVDEEGEVAVYDDIDQVVWLRRDGIHVKSPKTVRLEGDVIELVAHTALRQDVAGYASELKFTGGTDWTLTTWQTGATLTNVPNAIAPPLKFPETAE
jgi:phage gp45-like